jgi:nucleotide-binding universal stress UspA family protein
MKPILIPTDFSTNAAIAIKSGIRLALKTKAQLIFFHTSYFSESTIEDGLTYEDALKASTQNGQKKLKNEVEKTARALKADISGLNYRIVVDFAASAADSIIRIAEKNKVGLIITGTHGASRIKKFLFGSITSQLISSAGFPVLALPGHYKTPEMKELIYCTDLQNAPAEIRRIKDFNKELGARVEIVYFNYGWAMSREEQKIFDKLKKGPTPFTEVKTKLEHPLAEELSRYMKNKKDAVLCMFHQKKTGIAKFLFGGKTRKIAEELHFPLLSFPK